jgi:hypothetical protein
MKKMPFYKIFLITLSVFTIPTYVLVWYLESTNAFDGVGIGTGMGNTVMLAVVVSMLPALLASIWWWNRQYED